MSKFYEAPEMEIRKYVITQDVFTDSDLEGNGNLDDDDNNDYFK